MLSRAMTTLILTITLLAAGCVNAPAAEEIAPAAADVDAATTLGPATETIEGSIQFSAATPIRSSNYGGAFVNFFEVASNFTGVVVEVEWAATSPLSEQLSVWVRPSDAGNIPPNDPVEFLIAGPPLAQADGASPLRLALPLDAFPEEGEYEIVVRASAQPVGVAVEQPYTLHLTLFEDVAFDEAFTALDAADEA